MYHASMHRRSIRSTSATSSFVSSPQCVAPSVLFFSSPCCSRALGCAGHVQKLWADEGIQHTYEQRHMFPEPLVEHAKYFLDKIEETTQEGYTPSNNDMLRNCARTTGIVELDVVLGENKFVAIDVGGQRAERKKVVLHAACTRTSHLLGALWILYCHCPTPPRSASQWVHCFEEAACIIYVAGISGAHAQESAPTGC